MSQWLIEVEIEDKRLCTKDEYNSYGDCSQVFLKVDIDSYNQVCGKIIAYQYGFANSFWASLYFTKTINEGYLDGISLTYSKNPRKHIWSFAVALTEAGEFPESNCPCTNITLAADATPPPDFVGNDYFCDTGNTENNITDNPLWDGAGCGPDNTCCSLNNPPWFYKQLESSTSEDIEMRVCCNQDYFGEDNILYIEQIEIYVR